MLVLKEGIQRKSLENKKDIKKKNRTRLKRKMKTRKLNIFHGHHIASDKRKKNRQLLRTVPSLYKRAALVHALYLPSLAIYTAFILIRDADMEPLTPLLIH